MENQKSDEIKEVVDRIDNNLNAVIKKLKEIEQILNHLLETRKNYYMGNLGKSFRKYDNGRYNWHE